jgi:hypothetical protein
LDVYIYILLLAHALRVRAADVGRYVPYLDCYRQPSTSAPRFRVGMVVGAGDWDSRRSVPLAALEPLLKLPGVDVLSLRPGTKVGGLPISDFSSPSIDTLAARLCTLDAVVSVDTMVAHLAGALGRPVGLLLHSSPDWRWSTGASSVWYPTMRLFRQPSPGDWRTPIQALTRWLRAMATAGVRRRT